MKQSKINLWDIKKDLIDNDTDFTEILVTSTNEFDEIETKLRRVPKKLFKKEEEEYSDNEKGIYYILINILER